ncbi:hypothetical protein Dimus_010471 [Dionaea muscipula]
MGKQEMYLGACGVLLLHGVFCRMTDCRVAKIYSEQLRRELKNSSTANPQVTTERGVKHVDRDSSSDDDSVKEVATLCGFDRGQTSFRGKNLTQGDCTQELTAPLEENPSVPKDVGDEILATEMDDEVLNELDLDARFAAAKAVNKGIVHDSTTRPHLSDEDFVPEIQEVLADGLGNGGVKQRDEEGREHLPKEQGMKRLREDSDTQKPRFKG